MASEENREENEGMKRWKGITGKVMAVLLAAALTAQPTTSFAAVLTDEVETPEEQVIMDDPVEGEKDAEQIPENMQVQEEAAAYLKQNYIDNNKIIQNGGDSVVKSSDGFSYDVGLKTPSGSSITTLRLKKESSTSKYKSGWYLEESEYLKPQPPTYSGSRVILKRPSANEGKYSFHATLKLFDIATANADIDSGVAQPLAEQTFTISLAPEEKVYQVLFKAVDKETKEKINGAVIKVEKDWSTVTPQEDGSYSMKPSEVFTVSAEANGYVTYKNTAFQASKDGEQVLELERVKNNLYTYRFDVKNSKGAAIENATISVTEGFYDTVQPEADGSYKLSQGKTYRYRISAPKYEDEIGEINPSEDRVLEVVLKSSAVIEPEDTTKVEDAKKAFDNELGALRLKFKNAKNINEVVLEHLAADGVDTNGLTVSVNTTEDENYISKDGVIHYVKDETFGGYVYSKNIPCTFKFKSGEAEAVSNRRTVTIGWDLDFFYEQMQKECDALTADKLLGENASVEEIKKDLTLPQSMGTSAKKVWSAITWESSNQDIIRIQKPQIDSIINPAIGKVKEPAQDTKVTLTATFKANDSVMNSYVETPDDIKTITKTFDVTVKGNGEQKPTEETLLALLDKYYTVDQLKDAISGEVIDPAHVTGDIQLIRYTKIKDEKGQLVFKNKEIEVVSSNEKLLTVNGYRANVDVFSSENPEVKLLVKFTRDGVSVTKEIPLKVKVVTDAELDAELEKMRVAKSHYFEGINRGVNQDKNTIVENLNAFQEMRFDEGKNPVWIYTAKDYVGDGIIPDDFFEDPWEMEGAGYNHFKSSKNNVIQHDNLLVRRQENSTQVTISSVLSSAKYGKYAKAHPDNKKLQKLYKQPVEVTVTVKGTVVAKENLKKEITDARDFLKSIKEGSNPGEYPKGTIANLNQAIEDAQAVLDRLESTETEIENAVQTLKSVVETIKDTQNAKKAFVTMNGNPVSGEMGMQFAGDVYSDAALKAGFKKDAKYEKEVTVIDALVVMHQKMFGEDFNKNPQDYLMMGPTGWISKVFGIDTINIGFYVNDTMPKDENGLGTMANTSILKDNDVLTVFVYGSAYQQDVYLKFDQMEYAAEEGKQFEVIVTGFVTSDAMFGDVEFKPQSDCKVILLPQDTSLQSISATTDEHGKAILEVPRKGVYTMTVESCSSEFFVAPYAKVNVTENAALIELEKAKNAAKDELTSYKHLEDYKEEQQKELTAAIQKGKELIDQAKTVEEVNQAVKDAKAEMDAIKTKEEIEQENKKGDFNGDGKVSYADCVILSDKLLNGEEVLTVLGDMNGDGKVSYADCVILSDELLGR